jgi:flagellar biosynthetic protein FliP
MLMRKSKGLMLVAVCCLGISKTMAAAAVENAGKLSITINGGQLGGAPLSEALSIIFILTLLALLPAIVIAMTSFTRTIIVLSMLRHAFGMQDTPPNMVLISIALFLTLFTMSPAVEEIYGNSLRPVMDQKISVEQAVRSGIEPLRQFMLRQTREKDLKLIFEIAHAAVPDSAAEVATVYIVPAFLLSELKTAFQIGFVIFLPFLLLDLVVASILMSMGMLMVPPTVISLPLKVLMFVLIDGWALVVRALIGSFH